MRAVGAVILAAGASTRLGQPKQLLRIAGETLVQRTIRAAAEAGCVPIVVVTGAVDAQVIQQLDGTTAELVHNQKWERGLGTSIRAGLQRISLTEVSAVVLLVCDQLFVDAQTIAGLITKQNDTRKPIVASKYADTVGVPALFDRSCFGDLCELADDSGAKSLIESRISEVATVEFAAGRFDIDTPADLPHASASEAVAQSDTASIG